MLETINLDGQVNELYSPSGMLHSNEKEGATALCIQPYG